MSSSSKTTNLKMHSWARTDPVLCADFNENFNTIDTAIGNIWTSIGNLGSDYGTCQIYTGNYAGTGDPDITLNFDNLPAIIFFQKKDKPSVYFAIITHDGLITSEDYNMKMSIDGNAVTFYCNNSGYRGLNGSGYTYNYVAFGLVKGKHDLTS